MNNRELTKPSSEKKKDLSKKLLEILEIFEFLEETQTAVFKKIVKNERSILCN